MTSTVRLADIAESSYGLTASAKDEGPVKFLRITDIEDSTIRWSEVPFADAPPRELSRAALQPGDLVVARTGASVGRSAWVQPETPAVFASYLVRFRTGPNADSRYVGYVLRSEAWRQFIHASAHGKSAQPNISASAMSEFTFDLPELREQRAIAEVLGALDDKIAANTNLAATADDYLAARLSSMRTVETTELSAIADVNVGSVNPLPGGQLRYVDIASVSVGSFDYPELSSWDKAPGRARRRLRRGDTIWSTVRPNRRSHALNLSDDPAPVASTGLAVLTPRNVGFAYLYEVTRLPEFTAYLENVAEGSAYPAVRSDRFRNAPIPALDRAVIAEFESEAAPLREYVYSLSQENRTLAATRDALLPEFMSGKLRVRPEADEA